jgi:hypothetical protein
VIGLCQVRVAKVFLARTSKWTKAQIPLIAALAVAFPAAEPGFSPVTRNRLSAYRTERLGDFMGRVSGPPLIYSQPCRGIFNALVLLPNFLSLSSVHATHTIGHSPLGLPSEGYAPSTCIQPRTGPSMRLCRLFRC